MNTPPDETSRLRDQLAESIQREGEFRLKGAKGLLEAEERIRSQVHAIAERDTKIHGLNLAAVERDRYIHELHLEQIALREALHALHADLETFTWMLEKAGAPAPPSSPDLPGLPFTYHFQTPPYRIYRPNPFTLMGWAVPKDDRAISAVRARVDDRAFPGRAGLPAPEATAQLGPQAKNPNPGFEIDFETPPGRHRLRIEAQLEGNEWVSILNLPIWCVG
jgi:hypothetical protein